MTNAQLFFSIAGLFAAQTTFLTLYLNAKIDPVQKQVDMLVQYMVVHQGKIATLETKLEERTGGKKAS